jgi:hypothetical protein
VLCQRFVEKEALSLLSQYQCTMFFGVPTMYHRLLQLSDAVLAEAGLPEQTPFSSQDAVANHPPR